MTETRHHDYIIEHNLSAAFSYIFQLREGSCVEMKVGFILNMNEH
jgi:hypothetical protein